VTPGAARLSRRRLRRGLVALGALLTVLGCTQSTAPRSVPAPATAVRAPDVRPPPPVENASAGRAPAPRPAPAARAGSAAIKGRNAYVILSGGGTPLSNNYSQYLQARALAAFFEEHYGPESTWVFFGVGNRAGETPLLGDTRQEVKRDGLLVESWLPGALPRNRPATRASFLRALREEILPVVHDGGKLFLFIGDHGELSRSNAPESEITMWQLKRRGAGTNWYTDNAEVLGVNELRSVLSQGLGTGEVVFCMTQCHSGGFQHLAVRRTIAVPDTWFTAMSRPWPAPESAPFVKAAGFTATDEASLAAGCDPDPDSEKWAGYERFMPEQLLGLDLFTLQPSGVARPSFAAAHEAATLVDTTIDKPRATSELFLDRWARTIERLAQEPNVAPAVARAVGAFQRAVDTGRLEATSPPLAERAAQFDRFVRRMAEQSNGAEILLLTGTRRQLEQAIAARENRAGGRGGRRGSVAARQLWRDVVRPAWQTAVRANDVKGLAGSAREFELYLLAQEDRAREIPLPQNGGMLNEIFWQSGYADPGRLDRAKAEAVAHWGAVRRQEIMTWAAGVADEKVRDAAQQIGPGVVAKVETSVPGTSSAASTPGLLSRRVAAERTLFYRRVLAAWAFLLTMEQGEALAQLDALTALERTPLPAFTR
jgi:hypothetical protein